MNEILTIGIPVLAILFGILLNQRGLDKLESRLDGRLNNLDGRVNRLESDLTSRLDRMQSDINGRLDRMRADLSMFYRILGEHGTEIEHLKKD
jgi:hypothetical protein